MLQNIVCIYEREYIGRAKWFDILEYQEGRVEVFNVIRVNQGGFDRFY